MLTSKADTSSTLICFNVNKSCLLRCGPRYNKPCVPILLNGNLLHEWSTDKYLGVTFESGLKLKVSLAAKRMKFFRAFNYIYACVGSTVSPMLLCHLLHTYCLPILLYGFEAVTISNANRQTLYVTWKTALYKIFKLNDEVNLLVQYCLGILPISYVFDLCRLCFLFRQSTHIISVHNIFYDVFGFSEFNELCSVYSVGKLSHGHFKACVWYAFYVCIA